MKAYEIPGWLEGVKISRITWMPDLYINFEQNLNLFVWNDGEYVGSDICGQLFSQSDWEIYKEPKKKVTKWYWAYEIPEAPGKWGMSLTPMTVERVMYIYPDRRLHRIDESATEYTE